MKLYVNKLARVLVLILFVGIAVNGYAQPPKEGKGRGHVKEFMEKKKNFLIKETGMTQQEITAFFPLYEELQTKKFESQRAVRQKMKKIDQSKEPVSSQTYVEALEMMNNRQLKDAQLDNEYFKKFSKILSPEKLYRLHRAEMNFNREMLRGVGGPGAPEHRKK
ncbi:MAG: hypothetical protein RR202_13605 [Bacteroidales bacterium]